MSDHQRSGSCYAPRQTTVRFFIEGEEDVAFICIETTDIPRVGEIVEYTFRPLSKASLSEEAKKEFEDISGGKWVVVAVRHEYTQRDWDEIDHEVSILMRKDQPFL
jgi:hypothetical protein